MTENKPKYIVLAENRNKKLFQQLKGLIMQTNPTEKITDEIVIQKAMKTTLEAIKCKQKI